jgi:hypothetical protein
LWILSSSEDRLWYEVLTEDNETGWVEAGDLTYVSSFSEIPKSTSVPTYTPEPTLTPKPTLTPSPTFTPTPDPRLSYGDIDLRELDTYPKNHIGEKIKLRGSVFNIFDTGGGFLSIPVFQLEIGSVIVVVSGLGDVEVPEGIYEGTWITVYGTVVGTFEGTNAFGGTIVQPEIDADIIEK